MTDKEKNVIQWAFNLTEAIVAGDYRLPRTVNVAINKLQDAAWELAGERGSTPEKLCSRDFRKELTEYRSSMEKRLLAESSFG